MQVLGDFYEFYINMVQCDKVVMGIVKDKLLCINNFKVCEDIVKVVGEQYVVGINFLFNFGVEQDLKNVNIYMVGISQGGIGLLNWDYYFVLNKEEICMKYKEYIKNVFFFSGNMEVEFVCILDMVYEFEKCFVDFMMLLV